MSIDEMIRRCEFSNSIIDRRIYFEITNQIYQDDNRDSFSMPDFGPLEIAKSKPEFTDQRERA